MNPLPELFFLIIFVLTALVLVLLYLLLKEKQRYSSKQNWLSPILKPKKKPVKQEQVNISIEDLSENLELIQQKTEEEKDIVEGAVNFGTIPVSKIMKPRLQMVDVEIKKTFDELLQLVIESGYSRIPVYEENEDNIRGILYIKDILPHWNKKDFKWQSLIRPAYFVPESKKINDLLADFQRNKNHMAIIADEFGGTLGLVTLEDIVEELVGEIDDEYDENEVQYQVISENSYLVKAQMTLTDFFKIQNIDPEVFADISEEAETLAGLILSIKGEIPAENEIIPYKNYSFEIVSANSRKIESVKVVIK